MKKLNYGGFYAPLQPSLESNDRGWQAPQEHIIDTSLAHH